jgi:uncharacterized protein (DUF302 family)
MDTYPIHHHPFRAFFYVLLALMLLLLANAAAADNPALWKHMVKGQFATVLAQVKDGLITAQFQITGEENLSKGIENNKNVFPAGKWNTIGFDHVTAVHFCSVVFNQEVFNINLDWSVLCPFKVVAYTTKKAPDEVNLVMVKPTYILAKDTHKQATAVGQRIEKRIVQAIMDGLATPR